MKRLYVFVQVFLFCSLAFSQHPYSRGGNPLYWALVGGISAVMFCVFYLLFGLLVKFVRELKLRDFHPFEKLNTLLMKKGYEENKSKDKMYCNMLSDGEKLQEENSKDNHQGVISCKQCGKQIQAFAQYCSYCGANQSRTPTTLRRITNKLKDLSFLNNLVKKLMSFMLILALLAILGGIIVFICHEIGFRDTEESTICVFAPIAAYILYCLLNYVYKFNAKKKLFVITTLVLLVIALWGDFITRSIREDASRRAEAQKVEEMHRVNRTFLGCSFGDNSSKVSEILRKYVPNHLHPATSISGSGIDKIWLEDIQYGDYTLNTISFLFYQDRLYKVVMNVQTSKNESYSDLWTYNNLSTMLSKKYEKDYSARQYDNTENYCDAHTEVKLWHATYGMGEYKVTLTYYDKDSEFKEHQEEGF